MAVLTTTHESVITNNNHAGYIDSYVDWIYNPD